MAKHKPGHLFVIFVTLMLLLVTIFLYILADWTTPNHAIIPGLYTSTTRDVSSQFHLDIAPPDWSLNIWIFIYVYQLIWLVYGHLLICRKSNDWQGYLYYRPNFMPISLYVFYWFTLILNMAWVLTFDRKILQASSPILFGISFTLYICLGISYRALYREGAALLRSGQKRDVVMVRLFVQNGLSTFAAWTTIGSLLNFAQALAYLVPMDQKDASSIALGAMALEILGYLVLDTLLIDKYTRYTIMPYLVTIFFLAASLQKNWDFSNRNCTLTAVDLGLALFALLLKILFVIRKGREEPEPIMRNVN